MGFLKKLIRDSISKSVDKAVEKAIEPKATALANKAANEIDKLTQSNSQQANGDSNNLEGALGNLQNSLENYTNSLDKNIVEEWKNKLPQYPIWVCGGESFEIEEVDEVYYFTAVFNNNDEAINAVKKYCLILRENGFKPAGRNPNNENLYKEINGLMYHVDVEHCFDSDNCAPTIGFIVEK